MVYQQLSLDEVDEFFFEHALIDNQFTCVRVELNESVLVADVRAVGLLGFLRNECDESVEDFDNLC